MISKQFPHITLIFSIIFGLCGVASAKSPSAFSLQNQSEISDISINDRGPLVLQDNAGAEMELICPAQCKMVSKVNHHGEVASFCDCDGDGKRDKACQIWLKDLPNGEQRTYCQQQGCGQGEQCVKETKEFPSGEIQQSCECDSPFCDDIEEK